MNSHWYWRFSLCSWRVPPSSVWSLKSETSQTSLCHCFKWNTKKRNRETNQTCQFGSMGSKVLVRFWFHIMLKSASSTTFCSQLQDAGQRRRQRQRPASDENSPVWWSATFNRLVPNKHERVTSVFFSDDRLHSCLTFVSLQFVRDFSCKRRHFVTSTCFNTCNCGSCVFKSMLVFNFLLCVQFSVLSGFSYFEKHFVTSLTVTNKVSSWCYIVDRCKHAHCVSVCLPRCRWAATSPTSLWIFQPVGSDTRCPTATFIEKGEQIWPRGSSTSTPDQFIPAWSSLPWGPVRPSSHSNGSMTTTT